MSQQINLYSPIFRKQTKIFSATTMVQGLALIALVIAVFYYYVAAQSSLLELRAAESGQQLKSELERLKVYGARESPAERLKLLAERKKVLEETLASQSQALDCAQGRLLRAQRRLFRHPARAARASRSTGSGSRGSTSPTGSGELSLSGRAMRAELVPAYLERLRADQALCARSPSRCWRSPARRRRGPPPARRRAGVRRVHALLGRRAAEGQMKHYWRRIAARIDEMSLRQRAMLFATVSLVVVGVRACRADRAAPAAAEIAHRPRHPRPEPAHRGARPDRGPAQGAGSGHPKDPDQVAVLELEKRTCRAGEEPSPAAKAAFVAPNRLPDLLRSLLGSGRAVTLESLRTLPAYPRAGRIAELYRHGLEMTLRGSYLDLTAVPNGLEKMPARLLWGPVELQVEQYPSPHDPPSPHPKRPALPGAVGSEPVPTKKPIDDNQLLL